MEEILATIANIAVDAYIRGLNDASRVLSSHDLESETPAKEDRYWKCAECCVSFPAHVSAVLNATTGDAVCDACSGQRELGNTKCVMCGKWFPREQSISRLEKGGNAVIKPICPECDRSIDWKTVIKKSG